MDLVHELCPLQLLEVTKKRDILSGWLASIQHLAHIEGWLKLLTYLAGKGQRRKKNSQNCTENIPSRHIEVVQIVLSNEIAIRRLQMSHNRSRHRFRHYLLLRPLLHKLSTCFVCDPTSALSYVAAEQGCVKGHNKSLWRINYCLRSKPGTPNAVR